MDRRSFLKTAGVAVAGAAVAGTISLVPGDKQPARIADFTSGTLRRSFDGDWFFEFDSKEPFDISGRKELIVEIGDQAFSLQAPESIESTELVDCTLYRIRGNGWKRLKGEDRKDPIRIDI